MSTVTSPAPIAPSVPSRTGEWLPTDLAPVAAELVGTLRDYGPDDVAAVLAQIPNDRRTDAILVLAAMVDPDRPLRELLAWADAGPVSSRDKPPARPKPRDPGTPKASPLSPVERQQRRNELNRQPKRCPECGREVQAGNLARHRDRHVTQRAA